jgi:Flp pilus assembly pilin Flp
MELKNKLSEERGQGLVEYTFVILFVALMLWIGVKGTNASETLTGHWNTITTCVGSPLSCGS